MKRRAASILFLAVASAGPCSAGFRSADQGVLPGVGRTAGSFGSNWVTDLTIWNSGPVAAIVDLVFLPTGGVDNRQALQRVVEVGPISAGGTLLLPDVLLQDFGQSAALGAMLYFGSRADAPALVAPLIVQARVHDSSAAGFGTIEPGSPYYDEAGPGAATIGADILILPGLEESNDFRTNVGVWNGSDISTSIVVAVDFFDSAGRAVGSMQASLPPLGHLQWNGALASLGASGKGFSARAHLVSSTSNEAGPRPYFFAYASVTNNHSNDPSYIEPAYQGEEPVDCIFP
ncbi:MAG: hypothetical protein ACRD16_13685 [Thermoanaerobaculia bacterium]